MTNNSTERSHEPPADTEFPTVLLITSKPFDEHTEDTLALAEQWEQGAEVPHVVNFQDASRLQRVLTPRRLELLRSLMDEPAQSIRGLADRLERDVRQVHDDLALLHDYRIVHYRDKAGAKQPFVPYTTVRIEVELTTPTDSTANA